MYLFWEVIRPDGLSKRGQNFGVYLPTAINYTHVVEIVCFDIINL